MAQRTASTGGRSARYGDELLVGTRVGLAGRLGLADAQLLGRVTYEGFAAAWPAMEESTG